MKHIQPHCSKYIMRAKKFYATNKFLINIFKYLLSLHKNLFLSLCIFYNVWYYVTICHLISSNINAIN